MSLVLSTDNAFSYLIHQNLVPSHFVPRQAQSDNHHEPIKQPQIERRDYKNFNLWLRLDETHQYLIKQERFDAQGETSGDLAFEWRVQEFLSTFPALKPLQSLMTELLLYDEEQSILVSRYFPKHEDLAQFYERTQDYSPALAEAIGRAIATIHQQTWNPNYRSFLSQHADGEPINHQPRLLRQIDTISPDIFAYFSAENLEFFRLYQNTPQLHSTVQTLRQHWSPCCLIHRDLRLSNVVVQLNSVMGHSPSSPLPTVRLIDWEKFAWGDPAYDLGTLLAHHLRLWLGSFALHRDIPLKQALKLADLPLEILQPCLVKLVSGYLAAFPQIHEHDANFLERSLQLTGLVLLEKVLLKLEHRHSFANGDLCSMQVAQVLLNHPQTAAPQIFGIPWASLLDNGQGSHSLLKGT